MSPKAPEYLQLHWELWFVACSPVCMIVVGIRFCLLLQLLVLRPLSFRNVRTGRIHSSCSGGMVTLGLSSLGLSTNWWENLKSTKSLKTLGSWVDWDSNLPRLVQITLKYGLSQLRRIWGYQTFVENFWYEFIYFSDHIVWLTWFYNSHKKKFCL